MLDLRRLRSAHVELVRFARLVDSIVARVESTIRSTSISIYLASEVQRLLTAVSPQVMGVGELEDREMFEVDISGRAGRR